MENTKVLSKSKLALRPTRVSVLRLNCKVDAVFEENFRNFLEREEPKTQILLEINSPNKGEDDDITVVVPIVEMIRVYQKEKQFTFVMHVYDVSHAALLIAIAGDERMVVKKSRGRIQRFSARRMPREECGRLREWQYQYLKETLGMRRRLVDRLTNRKLSGDSMLRFGIATKRSPFW